MIAPLPKIQREDGITLIELIVVLCLLFLACVFVRLAWHTIDPFLASICGGGGHPCR